MPPAPHVGIGGNACPAYEVVGGMVGVIDCPVANVVDDEVGVLLHVLDDLAGLRAV